MFKPGQDRLHELMGNFRVFFGNVGRFIIKIPEASPQPLNLHCYAIYRRLLLLRPLSQSRPHQLLSMLF